jgi:tetratricopeptide (TPR) repeat protein
MVQVFVISIQRLDDKEEIADFIQNRLPRFAAMPWPHAIVSLTLGLRQPAEVRAMVGSEQELAEFYLYDGSRLLTLGRVEEARRSLQSCLGVPGRRVESLVADDQMRWTSQAPELVTGERRRIVRGMADSRRLMSEGRPAEAVAAARAVYDEAATMHTLSIREQLAAIDNYAYAQYQAGDLDGSLARCNESIALIEQRRLSGVFDTSAAFSIRSFILWDQGKRDDAIACAIRSW